MIQCRRLRPLTLTLLLAGLVAGTAAAGLLHLVLVESAPKKEETVTMPPGEIRLRFSERVEPRLTTITLVGADSAAIELGRVQVGPTPTVVVAPVIGTLLPGAYEVQWRTSARDGHVVRGAYPFTYRPAD